MPRDEWWSLSTSAIVRLVSYFLSSAVAFDRGISVRIKGGKGDSPLTSWISPRRFGLSNVYIGYGQVPYFLSSAVAFDLGMEL